MVPPIASAVWSAVAARVTSMRATCDGRQVAQVKFGGAGLAIEQDSCGLAKPAQRRPGCRLAKPQAAALMASPMLTSPNFWISSSS